MQANCLLIGRSYPSLGHTPVVVVMENQLGLLGHKTHYKATTKCKVKTMVTWSTSLNISWTIRCINHKPGPQHMNISHNVINKIFPYVEILREISVQGVKFLNVQPKASWELRRFKESYPKVWNFSVTLSR